MSEKKSIKGFVEYIRVEIRRERSPAEVADSEKQVARLRGWFAKPLPAVLHFAEVIGIAALLWAVRHRTIGIDHYLASTLLVALAIAAWLAFQSIWPDDPAPPRMIDGFTRKLAARVVASTLLSAGLMTIGYRMAHAFEHLQFGAKNPGGDPAESVRYEPARGQSFQPASATKVPPREKKLPVGPSD